MSLTLDTSMVLTIASLVIIGKVYKDMVGDKELFKRKLSKFTPIVLAILGLAIQIIYNVNISILTGALKGIICTAVACWGYDSCKFLWSKGLKNGDK
jgi:hypothetical protein